MHIKHKRLIFSIAAILGLVLVLGFVWLNYPAAEEAFQRDADIIRLRHLEHYGTLIEEYRDKTGKFPLQDSVGVPVYVHIANDEQIAFTKNGPPTPHKVVSMSDFVVDLESGLERTIKEYYDPQFRPYKKPNFYIYMFHDNAYFFAIHVHQAFPFARKVGEDYHKIEISNMANANNGACDPELLFAATEFTKERNKRVVKQKFFDLRDEKYLHYTKQKTKETN